MNKGFKKINVVAKQLRDNAGYHTVTKKVCNITAVESVIKAAKIVNSDRRDIKRAKKKASFRGVKIKRKRRKTIKRAA
jgi:hypothetical protein